MIADKKNLLNKTVVGLIVFGAIGAGAWSSWNRILEMRSAQKEYIKEKYSYNKEAMGLAVAEVKNSIRKCIYDYLQDGCDSLSLALNDISGMAPDLTDCGRPVRDLNMAILTAKSVGDIQRLRSKILRDYGSIVESCK